MSSHAIHRMHDNSLSAYRAEEGKLSRRAEAILLWINSNGDATDRQIAYGMGFGENLNAVRPRITELIEKRRLFEVAQVVCPITKRPVRKVGVRGQRVMFS